MVKRDSKERNVTNGFNAPSTQQQAAPEAPPPPPLPRGNYHNLHDFLQKDSEQPKRRGQVAAPSETALAANSRGGSLSSSSGDSGTFVGSKASFRVGGEIRKSTSSLS